MRVNWLGALVAANVLAAAGSAPARAAEPYKIDVILPMTGGASFLGAGRTETMNVLKDLVNKEGGIDGRPAGFRLPGRPVEPADRGPAGQHHHRRETGRAHRLDSGRRMQCHGAAPARRAVRLLPVARRPPAARQLSVLGQRRHARSHRGPRALFPVAGLYPHRLHDLDRCLRPGCRKGAGRGPEAARKRRRAGGRASALQSQGRQRLGADRADQECESAGFHRLDDGCAGRHGVPGRAPGRARHTRRYDQRQSDLCGDGAVQGLPAEAAVHADLGLPAARKVSTSSRQTSKPSSRSSMPRSRRRTSRPTTRKQRPGIRRIYVVAALRKLGTKATAEQVRAYIADQTDLPGVNGSYNFKKVPQRGLAAENAVVTRWDAAARTGCR